MVLGSRKYPVNCSSHSRCDNRKIGIINLVMATIW